MSNFIKKLKEMYYRFHCAYSLLSFFFFFLFVYLGFAFFVSFGTFMKPTKKMIKKVKKPIDSIFFYDKIRIVTGK